MPEREYEAPLGERLENPTDVLRVRIVTNRGQVVDFVAQYEAIIDNQRIPIVRYDGSHGQGHRDLLDRRGETIDKHWLADHLTLGESLTLGIQDITERWAQYRRAFLAHERIGGE